MARKIQPKKLIDTLEKLVAQRTSLLEQIADSQAELEKIDALFSDYGLSVTGSGASSGKKRRGRRPGPVAKVGKKTGKKASGAGRRTRGSFAKTAEESIIDFIKKNDRPSTSDVNKHWQAEGRGGKADNTLTKMVKDGKLKRFKDANVRGSCYEVA